MGTCEFLRIVKENSETVVKVSENPMKKLSMSARNVSMLPFFTNLSGDIMPMLVNQAQGPSPCPNPAGMAHWPGPWGRPVGTLLSNTTIWR